MVSYAYGVLGIVSWFFLLWLNGDAWFAQSIEEHPGAVAFVALLFALIPALVHRVVRKRFPRTIAARRPWGSVVLASFWTTVLATALLLLIQMLGRVLTNDAILTPFASIFSKAGGFFAAALVMFSLECLYYTKWKAS